MKKIEEFSFEGFEKLSCQFLCQVVFDESLAYTFLLTLQDILDSGKLDAILKEMDSKIVLALNADVKEIKLPARRLILIGVVRCGEAIVPFDVGRCPIYRCGNQDMPLWRLEREISDNV